MIRVTIFNEFEHERKVAEVKKVYPEGMHAVIADFLKSEDISVRTVTLLDEGCGLDEETLSNTDVLIWWGHMAHDKVPDEVAQRVRDSVLKGMGFIALHSAHFSKPFKLLMGTSCALSWRENGDFERVWAVNPAHPIVRGIGRYFELEHEEMYGEPFGIPEPEQLVLLGWYEGGEAFRSGCTYTRGNGKIFYFQPGHETYPTYYNKDVQTIIRNAVCWAAPGYRVPELECPNVAKIDREV